MIKVALGILAVMAISSFSIMESRDLNSLGHHRMPYLAAKCRRHRAKLTDFGAVGDGKTSNTNAFKKAINELSRFTADGGAQLIVPPGKWLTGSFNLTSNFTLFIDYGATILASQDESEWPVVAPLPSYGRGRDTRGPRFGSLISGSNLTDVVITGFNGTINGQGQSWWKKFKNGELKNTRPYLIEFMHSKDIQISNITLIDSPTWNIHPIYSKNIIVRGVTILAPVNSPNTDGINPDSCTNILIEDCYIVSGDDCIAVKSGWDQYGIKVGMPTQQLLIRRLTCISPDSAGVALGSEMSGGIKDVRIEDAIMLNTESGIRIKTAIGRGAYVKDIYARNITMKNMKYVFWMSGAYNQHADDHWDPKAIPKVTNINYRDIKAENVTMSGKLDGIENNPFNGICMSNVEIELSPKPKKLQWNCTNVAGVTSKVTPKPCSSLPEEKTPMDCHFPSERIPIQDVRMQQCFP